MPTWREAPANVRPMLASLLDAPLRQAGWVYEPKYDGIRAIAAVDPGDGGRRAKGGRTPDVALYSRNGHEKTAQFPAIADALRALAPRIGVPVVLDGEIVAVDRDGHPLGFQHLQGRIHLGSHPDIAQAELDHPAALMVFDLLREGDDDLRGQPLAARRLRLQARVKPTGAIARVIRLSELAADDGNALMTRANREGWEGLIAKDGHSTYQSGKRSPAWRKLKRLNEQEFVIGGWTEPRETRQHFGAILVGYYERDRLIFAGSVGTGFDHRELTRLAGLFAARDRAHSPFATPVKVPERPHWVAPNLVAAVRFTEWTHEGLLRQPVYLGTRDDKPAKDVRREPGANAPRASEEPLQRSPEPPSFRPSRTDSPAADRRSKDRRLHSDPPIARRSRRRPVAKADRLLHSEKGRPLPQPGRAALDAVIQQLHAIEDSRKDGEISLPNGDVLHVTNLAKVFWPALGITKGDLLRYYVDVAPLILPTVDDRPLVMKRFPNGIVKSAFYQQRHPESVPPGVRREALPEHIEPIDEEGPRDRLIGGSLTTLLYMTQLAAISQDPWFSRVSDPLHMDFTAIDLDPGEGVPFGRVLDVARWVKEELDALGVPGVPKTSGSRGLHIYIPLPKRTTYDVGQLLCQIVATMVATKHPKAATIERMVKRRPRGTVYVDYLQNILGKTLATAYSARASDYAGVSTPLTWTEVARGVDPHDFTVRSAPGRFRAVGDLWAPLRTGRPVDLNGVLKRAGAGRAR